MDYEAVIGLEVHAQLRTKSKIFCGCSTAFGAAPNTQVCPVCIGLPGVLPVLNREAVEMGIKTALALELTVNRESIWERKNYFYPDLPKGYQISQFAFPLAQNGGLTIWSSTGEKRIRIHRLHLEEDAGKLVHSEDAFAQADSSLVDFNRGGVPLMEIVSEPDLRTPEEAGAYLRMLRDVLVYLEVCDGNMEEGSLRCDANVSVRPRGEEFLGVRTELKNMNSFRHVEKALEYEIGRQIRVLREGGLVIQETRLWEEKEGRTRPMRGKEESHDYRYFPDPDLLPLVVDEAWIERVRQGLPELPLARQRRFMSEYGLPRADSLVLTADKALADYFEAVVREGADPKKASNWIMAELLRELKNDNRPLSQCPITPANLAAMIKMIDSGKITGKIGKTVFVEMFRTGQGPAEVIASQGLAPLADAGELERVCAQVLLANPKEVEQYRAGKTKLMGFFVGQVMKATAGKAEPKAVNQILAEKLKAK
jgi:aspartyl-tRNA(Asn)/glutamyl-tRNA(Gln) amidotransferase subunit B